MPIHVIDLGQCDLVIKNSKILQLTKFYFTDHNNCNTLLCTTKLLLAHLLPDPADQDEYGSIPDHGPLIPDPKTATKERGEKKLLSYFFVATNFTKLKIIYF
jgi:hypothetical protein